MGLTADRDLHHALRALNRLIENTNRSGGSVRLCMKEAPSFSIKLTGPIDIVCWKKEERSLAEYEVYRTEAER